MTVTTLWKVCALLAGGVGGGLIGSIAGLASLVSYPALLAVGVSPIGANVTNTVALVFGGLGSVSASGPELDGQGRGVRPLAFAGLAGGLFGAGLLLLTPSGSFELLVPWLIALASLMVLVAHRFVIASAGQEHAVGVRGATVLGAFLISIYGGYFGAAAGVVMIVLLQVTLAGGFARLNAIKNVVMMASNAVAAVVFAFASPVHWLASVPLAAGFFVGGRLGPAVTRTVPVPLLRTVICVMGLCLAVWLGIEAYG